jgi:hypothetical protein
VVTRPAENTNGSIHGQNFCNNNNLLLESRRLCAIVPIHHHLVQINAVGLVAQKAIEFAQLFFNLFRQVSIAQRRQCRDDRLTNLLDSQHCDQIFENLNHFLGRRLMEQVPAANVDDDISLEFTHLHQIEGVFDALASDTATDSVAGLVWKKGRVVSDWRIISHLGDVGWEQIQDGGHI